MLEILNLLWWLMFAAFPEMALCTIGPCWRHNQTKFFLSAPCLAPAWTSLPAMFEVPQTPAKHEGSPAQWQKVLKLREFLQKCVSLHYKPLVSRTHLFFVRCVRIYYQTFHKHTEPFIKLLPFIGLSCRRFIFVHVLVNMEPFDRKEGRKILTWGTARNKGRKEKRNMGRRTGKKKGRNGRQMMGKKTRHVALMLLMKFMFAMKGLREFRYPCFFKEAKHNY